MIKYHNIQMQTQGVVSVVGTNVCACFTLRDPLDQENVCGREGRRGKALKAGICLPIYRIYSKSKPTSCLKMCCGVKQILF
jgi:hypothetical protein